MSGTTVRIGAIDVEILVDGADSVPPGMILVGAAEGDLPAMVEGQADANGWLPVAYNGLLIRSAGAVILVDAGFGEMVEEEGTGGDLLAELRSRGIAPERVEHVIVSHGHADHIGGLVRTDGQGRVPVYPNASHWFERDEWVFWTSEASLAAMPSDFAEPARACLPPLAATGLVELVDAEREIVPGVRIVPAPGHTPGHAAVEIESERQRALYVGDAVFHPVNLEYPAFGCVFDVDGAAAARTRGRLLLEASRDGSLLLAAHIAAFGRVEGHGDRYRWLPG